MNNACLQIFIAAHCELCEEAVALASAMREAYPSIRVDVVDVQQPDSAVPAEVFATPTYVWNGKVISLGNPTRAELSDLIATQLAARSHA